MSNYKIWLDDDGIIRCILKGIHEKKDAEVIIEEIINLSKESGKARVLIDLNNTEESTSGARRVYIDTIKAEPEIIEKLAFLGSSAKNRVMANFIITGSGRENEVRYFESEEEALRWIKD